MSDLELNDIELKEHDPYHDYIEEKARDAEFESVSLQEEYYKSQKDFINKDDYIYHVMWPLYFLSNWHEWF